MKNASKILLFVLLISSMIALSACDLFKDKDDFDNPPQPEVVTNDESKPKDLEDIQKDADELIKQMEDLQKEIEDAKNEDINDNSNNEIVEDKKDEPIVEDKKEEEKVVVEDNKEEKKEEPKNEVKQNIASFASKASWSGTIDKFIKMGDAGKIRVFNSKYSDAHNGEDCIIAMKIEKVLTDAEVQQTITDHNNKSTIVHYPAKKTNYDWHGVRILLDLKDYPIEATGDYIFAFPVITIVSQDDFPYFYIDEKPYLTMESFYLRRTETPFYQGDILEYDFIFTLPEGYKDPAYIKVINSYDKQDANQYSFFRVFN